MRAEQHIRKLQWSVVSGQLAVGSSSNKSRHSESVILSVPVPYLWSGVEGSITAVHKGVETKPPHRCKRGTLLLKKEEKFVASVLCSKKFLAVLSITKRAEVQSSKLFNLDTCVLILVSCVLCLDTKKLNNSPSRRVRSKHKTSCLSSSKLAGAKKPKFLPVFLISFGTRIVSPSGEMSAGQRGEGAGIFANNLKQVHAYET